jgi:GntR family transcriptional regulator
MEPRTPEPLYQQVAAAIRIAIRERRYRPGQQLPAERDLAEQFALSRATIRASFKVLETERLIVYRDGIGAFVHERPPVRLPVALYSSATRPDGLGPFEASCAAAGLRGEMRLIAVERIPANASVAAELGIELYTPLIRRRRHAVIDDQVVRVDDAYMPAKLVDGTPLAGDAKLVGGVSRAWAAIGHPLVAFTERLTARMPTPAEIAVLQPNANEPVLVAIRQTLDADNRVVELRICVARSSRAEFTIEQMPMVR